MTRFLTLLGVSLVFLASSIHAQQPKKKSPPTRVEEELARFQALHDKARLAKVEKEAGGKDPFVKAEKGDLAVVIVERGSIEPLGAAEIICQLKARTKDKTVSTIKWLIDDGSVVKKGDKLATIDDSALQDDLKAATVKVNEATTVATGAKEELTKVQRLSDLDIREAEVDLKLALVALKDRPSGQSKEVLELRVEKAKLVVERAQARAMSEVSKASTTRKEKDSALQAANDRSREIAAEIKLCTLTAPMDGLVVYYVPESRRFGRPAGIVEVGSEVREGQKLFRVFDMKQFAIATKVHEAVISRVRSGQETQIYVDAYPGSVVKGKVKQVATTASASDWAVGDVKVYAVQIAIEEPPSGLKPSMSAEVRIKTGERKGVLKVPSTAIWNVGKNRICFVKVGDELVERRLVLGSTGADAIEVVDGLKEGESVLSDIRSVLSPR